MVFGTGLSVLLIDDVSSIRLEESHSIYIHMYNVYRFHDKLHVLYYTDES